jgi:8-oxo-dGTP diphosphatase
MVMVQDKNKGLVLVIDRVKKWKGLSFPGGHMEKGESAVDSAIRETKEETGLDIKNLKLCGIVNWYNPDTHARYIEFLYKTSDFSGNIINGTDEGKVFWIHPDEILGKTYANNFHIYLPLFFDNKYTEAFGIWDDEVPAWVEYK